AARRQPTKEKAAATAYLGPGSRLASARTPVPRGYRLAPALACASCAPAPGRGRAEAPRLCAQRALALGARIRAAPRAPAALGKRRCAGAGCGRPAAAG